MPAFVACAFGLPVLGRAVPGPLQDHGPSQASPATASATPAADRQPSPVRAGCRTAVGHRHRYLPLLILAAFWLPVLAAAQPPGAGVGTDLDAYPAYDYPHGDGGGVGAYPRSRGDEPSFDYPLPSPGGGFDPERAPVPRSAYPGYSGPYPSGNRSFPGPGSSFPASSAGRDSYGAGYPESGAGQGGEGFRFRGDKQVSDGRWRESPSAPGYRFRPMSPEELERSTGGDGWRPITRDDRRAADRGDMGPADAGAVGYQSDSWFRKYYGERP